ncbi:MAG: methyltransferase domain-containing protein [Pseudomonadota bacterium]|nr:methyltransferase domain-containing protein [Pseudomonadota bacterium]
MTALELVNRLLQDGPPKRDRGEASVAAVRLVVPICIAMLAACTHVATSGDIEELRVAPYADTPSPIVTEMLKLARVGPGDYVVDLGSGDGRLVITAVKDFGARAGLGVDINERLVAYATASAASSGVADRAKFVTRDLFATDISGATVVTVYLFPAVMGRLRDKLLAELAPGTRVVSHDFPFPRWSVDRVATFAAPEKDDTVGRRDAVVYLYTVPPRH